jgi:4a-hydroxytetrahydrobiopterin dehydratase
MDPSHLLSAEALSEQLPSIPLWSSVPHASLGVPTLTRSFTAKSFPAAMAALNAAGEICEAASHHADLHLTSYREVQLVVYTHSVGGVTLADVELAKGLDGGVKVEYSPKWLKEHPEALGTEAAKK